MGILPSFLLVFLDGGHSFENILLYGLELTLATFELLTFLMIDLMWRNYLLAAMGTFAISKVSSVGVGAIFTGPFHLFD